MTPKFDKLAACYIEEGLDDYLDGLTRSQRKKLLALGVGSALLAPGTAYLGHKAGEALRDDKPPVPRMQKAEAPVSPPSIIPTRPGTEPTIKPVVQPARVSPPPAVTPVPPVKAPVKLPTTKGDTPELTKAIADVAKQNNWNAKYLKAIISFETGWTFDVAQKNRAGSGATGLIQFMPRTAKGLGTTTDKLAKMSQVEQMKYVEKFLKPYLSKSKRPKNGWTLEDMYMAVFYPKAVGKKNSTVLFKKGTTAYKQNIGLDPLVKSKKFPKGARKGYITKAMAAAKVRKHLK